MDTNTLKWVGDRYAAVFSGESGSVEELFRVWGSECWFGKVDDMQKTPEEIVLVLIGD